MWVVEAEGRRKPTPAVSQAGPLHPSGPSQLPSHAADTCQERGPSPGSSRWLGGATPGTPGVAGDATGKENESKGERREAEIKVRRRSGGCREREVRASGGVASRGEGGDAACLPPLMAGLSLHHHPSCRGPHQVPPGESLSCPKVQDTYWETSQCWSDAASVRKLSLNSSSARSPVDVGGVAGVTPWHWHCSTHRPGSEVRRRHLYHPSHTTTDIDHRHQDYNNNIQKSELRDFVVCVSGGAAARDNAPESQPPAERRDKSCRRRRTLMTIIDKTFTKIKALYKNYKHSGRRTKAKWSIPHIPMYSTGRVGGGHTMLQNNEQIISDRQTRSDMSGGQQRGDQSPTGQGRHWRQANSDGGRHARGSRAQPGDAVGRSYTHASTLNTATSAVQRSIEVDTISRRNKTRGEHGLRRSISTEDDRSDELYLKTFKYRDKSLNRRAKRDISSSSEDPTTGVQPALRVRPTRLTGRKKSSPSRRTESAVSQPGSEHGRSRRRQARRMEQSSSSLSSSSSRSDSVTRTAAGSSLRTPATNRHENRTRVTRDVVHSQASAPPEQNSRDNTKVFLERLDSVLSDLVESEKKKISKYGQTSVREGRPESESVNLQSRKKYYKKREGSKEKDKNLAEGKPTANPAVQQLRTTLKTVRVKKKPPPGDVLEKHSEWFTDGQPHNPRILRSQRTSQLLTQRCYQPPRRRPPRPRPRVSNNPSDFYSSDEDHEDAAVVEPESATTEEDPREEQSKPGDGDDEDTCYGSDYQGSQAPRPPDLTPVPQRPPEAADSGDFSVDSAYTGSRGATPENVLNPAVKPRRQSGSLSTLLTGARFRQPRTARCLSQVGRLQQLKRDILSEIRESKLYSDESINSLLEQYRHKCCHLSTAELDLVTKSVQEDLGVKPRPAQYLYQILVAAEEDHTQPEAVTRREAEAEDASLLTLQSTGKTYLYERRRREAGCPGRPHSSSSRHAHGAHRPRYKTMRPPRPRRSQDETEEEAWARTAVGPGLVTEAREEVQRGAAPDTDWSHYVAQLCQQFEIKM